MNQPDAIAALRAAAVLSQGLADDLERGRLCDGQFQRYLQVIREQLARAESAGPTEKEANG